MVSVNSFRFWETRRKLSSSSSIFSVFTSSVWSSCPVILGQRRQRFTKLDHGLVHIGAIFPEQESSI